MAGQGGLDSGGDHRVSVNENLGGMRRQRNLVDEDSDVDKDKQQRDDGEGTAGCEVLQRDQTFLSPGLCFSVAVRVSIICGILDYN